MSARTTSNPRTSIRVRGLMKRLALASALCVVPACGGDSTGPDNTPTPDALAPFVGRWTANTFVHTLRDDATTTVDLIAEGASFTVDISATGSYVGTVQVQTETRTETGTLRVVGSELVIQPVSPPGPEERVTFIVSGSNMTWTGLSEYDFNIDGIPSPTNVRITFTKS